MADRRPLAFVPYHLLDGVPNVVVDGSATEGTTLTLSHWPHSVAPPGLEADLSAQMALAYLDRWDLHQPAAIVSNNHFDQDGLVSVFALVEPETAMAHREFMVDVAAAGDFATYRHRDAARVSMVISAFGDPTRSPLAPPADDHHEDYQTWSAALYDDLLGRLPELCEHPERYRESWAEEDATLDASENALRSGDVQIEEVPALDLAIINVPPHSPDAGGHRFGGQWVTGLHPMAVHNATSSFGLLSIRGMSYQFNYRYETWVQYRSRRPRPRVDLRPLADQLTAEETSGGRWVFEGVEALAPRLYLEGAGESSLSALTVRRRLEAELRTAPPAWDPYP